MQSKAAYHFTHNIASPVLTLEDTCNFNEAMRVFEASNQEETFDELNKSIVKVLDFNMEIKERSFSWTNDRTAPIEQVFKLFANLSGPTYYEMSNMDFLTKKFSLEDYVQLIDASYGRVNNADCYSQVMNAYTSLLNFINNSVVLRALALQPRLATETVHLYDPIFRVRVRSHNRATLNAGKLGALYTSDLKALAYKCSKKFFPAFNAQWTTTTSYAHVHTLKLFVALFEYGVWQLADMPEVINHLHSMYEVMFNLENYMCRKSDVLLSKMTKEEGDAFMLCREHIASCFVHILLIYMDDDLNEKMAHFNVVDRSLRKARNIIPSLNKQKLQTLFKNSAFFKEKSYTYFTYILVTYLNRSRDVDSRLKIEQSPLLVTLVDRLFTYVSDINGDMFAQSLKMMRGDYSLFYYAKEHMLEHYDKVRNGRRIVHVPVLQDCVDSFAKLLARVRVNSHKNDGELLGDFVSAVGLAIEFVERIFASLDQTNEGALMFRRMVMTLRNLPQHVLTLVRVVSKESSRNSNAAATVRKGFALLRQICTGNGAAVNQLFSGYNFSHICEIFESGDVGTNEMIKELVIAHGNTDLNECQPNILPFFFKHYQKKIEEVFGGRNSDHATLMQLHSFNVMFSTQLKKMSKKRSKFELLLANAIAPYLETIVDHLLQQANNVSEHREMYNNWRNFGVNKTNFYDNIDKMANDQAVAKTEIYRSLLQLFNRATNRFYTNETADFATKIVHRESFMENCVGLFKSELGMSIASQLTRLYANFSVFMQNHLLNGRFEKFESLEVEISNRTLDPYLSASKIIADLLMLKNASVEYRREVGGPTAELKKFDFCTFLPLIFKYYNDMVSSFIQQDHENKVVGFDDAMVILDEFTTYIQDIEMMLSAADFAKKKRDCSNDYCTAVAAHVNEFQEKRDKGSVIDTSKDKSVKNIKLFSNKILNAIMQKYRGTGNRSLHLEKFLRFCDSNESVNDNNVMLKKLRVSNVYIQDQDVQADADYNGKNLTSRMTPQELVAEIRRSYTQAKSYYYEQPERNACFTVLQNVDFLKDNRTSFVRYFFKKMAKVDVSFESLQSNVLVDSSFFSAIVMMDNLMRISDDFRDIFFSFISEDHEGSDLKGNLNNTSDKQLRLNESVLPLKKNQAAYNYDPENVVVLRKIWQLHKLLLHFSLYKTYYNRDWAELYSLYFMVSNFLQNLCENNHVGFKEWFKATLAVDDGSYSGQNRKDITFLQDYHDMYDYAFRAWKLHRDTSSVITLPDRSETFNVLARMIVGITENINGGGLKQQFNVRAYKIELWISMIFKMADDIDSLGYQLTLAMLTYIFGLIEGKDGDVLKFVASQFSVTRLYNLVHSLIKKLYVRQYFIVWSIDRPELRSTGLVPHIIDRDNEKEVRLDSSSLLLEYYMRHNETFNEHILIEICITIFIMIKNLSKLIVKYENFINEKDLDIHKYIVRRNIRDERLEPLYVWNFLQKIIVDIEVHVSAESDESEDAKDADDNNESTDEDDKVKRVNDDNQSELQVCYFKKLPQCFFLTSEVKDEFIDHVNIDSTEMKHEQFFDAAAAHIVGCQGRKSLFEVSTTLYRLSSDTTFVYLKWACYTMTLLINLLMLIFFKPEDKRFMDAHGSGPEHRPPHIVGVILPIINIVIAGFSLLLWFSLKYATNRRVCWARFRSAHNKNFKAKWYHSLQVNVYHTMIKDTLVQYFALQTLFTVLGLVVNPFCFTLLPLLLIYLSPIMYNILLSLLNNYDKLFYTLVLIGISINSFSYLATKYYRDEFVDSNGNVVPTFCDNFFKCMLSSINKGLRNGGGVSDSMNVQISGIHYSGRFFFDVFFFIFVNLILLAIFFGIIVDSFKELRDEMTKRKRDEADVCFACGIERMDVERKGLDFEEHQKEHDIWKYLFYLMYLQNKNEGDYNGTDIYVAGHINDDFSTAWIPKQNSLAMEAAGKKV